MRICHASSILKVIAFSALTVAPLSDAFASAQSHAQVDIQRPFPAPSKTASTSGSGLITVSDQGAALSARSVLSTGSVGIQVSLPPGGIANGLSARAEWGDGWGVNTLSNSPTVPISATISFNGSIDTDFVDAAANGTVWPSFFSLLLQYEIGDHTFTVSMDADNEAPSISAHFDRLNIDSSLLLTTNALNPTKTDFLINFVTPAFDVGTSGFFDGVTFSYQSDGALPAFDAIHTFRVTVRSTDPTVTLTADGGRTSASAVPTPATLSLQGVAILSILFLFGAQRQTRRSAEIT